jgi:light-regulated signal transduction histidine kinase (bacteriophytochrome)
MPAFGQADLSNCEREQIHLAGSIQPHGALLLVRETDFAVLLESANAAGFLNIPGPLTGRRLDQLGGDLLARLLPWLDAPLHQVPATFRCRLGEPAADYDAVMHRPPGGGLVIELERSGPPVDLSAAIEAALKDILGAYSLRALGDETARIFRDLAGYDRVMVYRFDDDGHGEVFAERRRAGLEAYLGNRYPASDIPQIARRLYERNRVRVLVDAGYQPVPLIPARSPVNGGELDMSLCFLRSMSPIHVQYMQNMGVSATLVASLVVGGRLWGLVACHHYKPLLPHIEVRTACELLAEAIATRIAALESFVQAQAELSVRRLEQRLIEAISRDGEWCNALFDSAQTLLQPVGASGAALLFEGQLLTAGEVPGPRQLRDLGAWLDARPRVPVFATASLGLDEPAFGPLAATASGLLVTAVSNAPGDYLMWFRPEQVRTVTWGGDPFKPVLVGDDPAMLSPRRSFAQWHQRVEGTSEPWTQADLAAGRLIGDTVSDVVLQVRAVRLLIAQSQLDDVRRQVRLADHPVLIADAEGQILLGNEAFHRLLPAARHAMRSLHDLPACFAEPAEIRQRLADVIAYRHTWRGEVRPQTATGPRSLLVRADPVFSAPGHVLGFVFLFTDLSDRKAAEAARRRFQESVMEGSRAPMRHEDPEMILLYRSMMSAVVENAQLAALEITDGLDMVRMAELLESVRNSVTRAAEMLEHLIHQSRRATGQPGGGDR